MKRFGALCNLWRINNEKDNRILLGWTMPLDYLSKTKRFNYYEKK
jgi:hypothetical protein